MKYGLLLGAVILAGWLRLTNMVSVPPILNRDEAAIGYNALLLHQTGQDEWGERWPLVLKSFGDAKLIGYPSLVVGLFKFLTPEDWVVRLPSLLAGTLLPLAVYMLVKAMWDDETTAILSSYLVAITPIFIYFSRMAFEANVALLLTVIALSFFWRERSKWWQDVIGGGVWLLAILTYNTPWLLSPFLGVILWLWHANSTHHQGKNWLGWHKGWRVMGILVVTFMIGWLLIGSASAQKTGISIFSDKDLLAAYPEYRLSWPSGMQTILGNKYAYYAQLVLIRFGQSWLPNFLIIKGGQHPWHALPGWGHLTAPVFALGWMGVMMSVISMLSLIKTNRFKSFKLGLFLMTLVIGLAPSVITVDAPHATRSLWFMLMWLVFSAMSIRFGWQQLYKSHHRLAATLISLFLLINILWPSYNYFLDYLYFPTAQRVALQVGLVEVLTKIKNETTSADQIAWVDGSGYDYVVIAWYLKLPSAQFHQTVTRLEPDTIGFRHVSQITNIRFIDKKDYRLGEKMLVYWKDGAWRTE